MTLIPFNRTRILFSTLFLLLMATAARAAVAISKRNSVENRIRVRLNGMSVIVVLLGDGVGQVLNLSYPVSLFQGGAGATYRVLLRIGRTGWEPVLPILSVLSTAAPRAE